MDSSCIVSLSDGTTVPNPNFLKKQQRRLEIRQRSLARSKKGSGKRKKAGKRIARLHQRIRRQREDFQWKAGKQIAQKADVIAFEELNIKGMKARCKPKKNEEIGLYLRNGQSRKAGLNKAISDASWYSLRIKTEHQAGKLGNRVLTVNPRYTSQECSECHYISPKNREKEKFVCERCGHHADADEFGDKKIGAALFEDPLFSPVCSIEGCPNFFKPCLRDIDGAVVIGQRALTNLGIASLRVVSPKVMPKLESTSCKEISLPVGGEPGNLIKVKWVQMSLFDLEEWETG